MEGLDTRVAHFAFPDVWKLAIPEFDGSLGPDVLFQPIDLDIANIKLNNPYAPSKSLSHDLRLQDLDSFDYGAISELDLSDGSVASLDEQIPTFKEEPYEDVWKIANDLGPINADIKLHTWEAFFGSTQTTGKSGYISEAGPVAFDAALELASQSGKSAPKAGSVIRSDVLMKSLFYLGIGRASVLFQRDKQEKSFFQAIEGGRMSGFSCDASQSLIRILIDSGSTVVQLRGFSEATYSSSMACPAHVALAGAVSSILTAIEQHIVSKQGNCHTLLQLQDLFQHPLEILKALKEVVDCSSSATTNHEVASRIFDEVQQLQQTDSWSNAFLLQTMARSCRPWLQDLERAVGLCNDFGSSDVRVTDLHASSSLLSQEDKDVVEETSNGLRHLKAHYSDHPLLNPGWTSEMAPTLEWIFEWVAADKIVANAKSYELSLIETIKTFRVDQRSRPTSTAAAPVLIETGLGGFGMDEVELLEYIQQSQTILDSTPSPTTQSNLDGLQDSVKTVLESRSANLAPGQCNLDFRPPISVMPSLSFSPILAAQHSAVNFACLRSLFIANGLRNHFSLHYAFHLFGSGTFSARLSQVLFDPELAATERKRGVMRTNETMGLRLGADSDRTWPPASSELSLALMGVLNESWRSGSARETRISKHDQLPGGLCFGIRELPTAEVDKCLDIHSVQALDFLRLQYKPPGPLAEIFTEACLEKYDRAFKFFVRLTRMKFVVDMLWRGNALELRQRQRDSRLRRARPVLLDRFRLEAHHFISMLSTHISDAAIAVPWRRFQVQLDEIETALGNGTLEILAKVNIIKLQRLHAETLDNILASMLLRQRQQAAAKLLEEIFYIILTFARLQTVMDPEPIDNATEGKAERPEDSSALYKSFKQSVRAFIQVCEELGEMAASGIRSRAMAKEDASRSARELAELLNLSGFYADTKDLSAAEKTKL